MDGETMTPLDSKTPERETQIESRLQARMGSQVRHIRIECRSDGVILQGCATTYHAKQMAQHLVMEITNQPIIANEIEVC